MFVFFFLVPSFPGPEVLLSPGPPVLWSSAPRVLWSSGALAPALPYLRPHLRISINRSLIIATSINISFIAIIRNLAIVIVVSMLFFGLCTSRIIETVICKSHQARQTLACSHLRPCCAIWGGCAPQPLAKE